MKASFLAIALALTTRGVPLAGQQPAGPPPVRATFALLDTTGARAGQVTAIQDAHGVVLQILAFGLTPGEHGLHVHAAPACVPPSFAAAQGHFNPGHRQHGLANPAGPHAGDLPNLVVDAGGVGRAQVRLDSMTLTPGPRSLGAPGTALVIHAQADDNRSDPAGNAGPRVRCASLVIP